jgi:hypothetical protein
MILALTATVAGNLQAQAQQGKEKKKKKEAPQQIDMVPHDPAPLFAAEEPITFTVTANFRQLRRDKKADAPWRTATITVADSAGAKVDIPIKVKTRGIWRLRECDFPPLRLDFAKSTVKQSLFAKLDKPKLVTHCRDNEEYEQYILQEFQLYRIYNLLTEYSHRVRLAHVTYADSGSGTVVATRYAFLEEEPDALAHRVGGIVLRQTGAGPSDLEPQAATVFGLFQYLIGNTDFSVPGLHNIELIGRGGDNIPIAYDFDFTGAVNTRYATTDPSLPIKRVRERLFRGYCMPNETYPPAFALFNAKRDSITALYHDPIGQLLKGNRVRETLEYFDDFYKTINDQGDAKALIINRCLGKS